MTKDVVQRQYSDEGITNSQLLRTSDRIESQSAGIPLLFKLDHLKNYDCPVMEVDDETGLHEIHENVKNLDQPGTQELVTTQAKNDVEWTKTVDYLVESCEKGGTTIKSEILCKVTKDEEKVKEVCGIVTEWSNHITSEAVYCHDKNLEAYTKGLTDRELQDLIAFRPGRPKVFQTAGELNDWIKTNQRIQESLENQSLAARYLARLKKFQILEQIFSGSKSESTKIFSKYQKTRLKAEYLLMKFAVENHSLGLDILRFVDIPWSKYSGCKEFRDFIDSNGLEFPSVVEAPSSQIKEVKEDDPQEDFVCTQDFKSDLTDRDLRTLDHNKWLNDQVIAYYGAHVISRSSRSDIYFVHSTVFALGSKCRMVPVQNNYKVFAFSTNLQNQHRALVLVHLEQRSIFYADSWPLNRKHHFYQDRTHIKKNGEVKSKFQFMLSKIDDKQQSIKQQVVSILGANGFDIQMFKWCECVMPIQGNGSDCGLYVLKYLEDFLENEHELLNAWGQGKELRSRYGGVNFDEYRDHIKSILE